METADVLLRKYIEAQKNSWSESTKKTAASKLRAFIPLLGEAPEKVWQSLQSKGAYTRVTDWILFTAWYEWCLTEKHFEGQNIYRIFRTRNKLAFRNVYKSSHTRIDFKEAKRRIQTLPDAAIRRKALELLGSGMRYSESFTFRENQVLGKGNKLRSVYKPIIAGPEYTGSHTTFWRQLACIGLKPHDLRKLAANNLLAMGMNIFDLCEVMGWNDIKTAMRYIAPTETKELMEKVKKALA